MKVFNITDTITVVCETSKTRNGFKHTATLMDNGLERESVKINYLNRTWERYEFDSVLEKLAEKSGVTAIKEYVDNRDGRDDPGLQHLKTVAAVADLADIFTSDQKASNDWKARMLRAGLEGKGLIMPEDWNQLDESTKEMRLNKAIQSLKES